MGDFIQPNAPDADKLFGYKLTGKYLPFVVTAGGIFTCYCLSSVSQEYVYQTGFNYTSFLTLCAKLFGVLWGAAGGGLRDRKAPHRHHAFVGFLGFATMWLSNQSLLTLNYPTQTLFKSAKLIPVMVGALIINGKKFHRLEYASAMLLLVGLVSFTLTDITVTPNFDPIGVVFVSLSLIADALIGNWQELMFSQFGASANEMMTYSNGWAALLSLFLCMVEGNNMAAIDFLLNDSMAVICIFVYCFLNILGIYFVLVMIAMFGATLTAFTTSLRKALSLVLSFLVYTKPFAWGYLFGGVVTALGIACNMHASALKRAERDAAKAKQVVSSKEMRPLILDRGTSTNASAGSVMQSPDLPTSPNSTHAAASSGVTVAASPLPSALRVNRGHTAASGSAGSAHAAPELDTRRLLATLDGHDSTDSELEHDLEAAIALAHDGDATQTAPNESKTRN